MKVYPIFSVYMEKDYLGLKKFVIESDSLPIDGDQFDSLEDCISFLLDFLPRVVK